MGVEYRIFFPLPSAPATATAAQGHSSAASAAPSSSSGTPAVTSGSSPSGGAPAAAYSLQDLADFRAFQPDARVALPVPEQDEEGAGERTDVYLLDAQYEHMATFGLKLRGSSAGASSGSSSLLPVSASTALPYKLELKVCKKKEPTSGGVGASEKWKKVVRADIHATYGQLLGAMLAQLENTAATSEVQADAKLHKLLASFVEEMKGKKTEQEKAYAAAAAAASSSSASSSAPPPPPFPFHFVAVSKQRLLYSEYEAEQTDVRVTLLPMPGSAEEAAVAAGTAQAREFHYRSICFQKEHAAMPEAQALFTHLLKKYPAAAASSPAASASSSSSSAGAAHATSGAIIAGYPQFLLTLLASASK